MRKRAWGSVAKAGLEVDKLLTLWEVGLVS